MQKSNTAVDSEVVADHPVICEAKNSFTCSVVLDTESSHLMMVTVSGSDARAPSVLLRIPARPGEPVFACLMHAMFIFRIYLNYWNKTHNDATVVD